jgi:hypothetical protein
MATASALPSIVPITHSSGIGWRHSSQPETLDIEIAGLCCPRGRITEITGPVSSGRTTLLHGLLSAAGQSGEYCAIVDAANSFDPHTATQACADMDTLVWVRCSGNLEHAMKSTDLLVHSGGFGVVVMDLCDMPQRSLERIPLSWWYRYQRAVESTSTVLLILNREPQAKACASLIAELGRGEAMFSGMRPFRLLTRTRFRMTRRKPVRSQAAEIIASAISA